MRVVLEVLKGTDAGFQCDRLVLLALAAYAHDETGEAFVSVETLATQTGNSQTTVKRALTRLRELGYVEPYEADTGREGLRVVTDPEAQKLVKARFQRELRELRRSRG